MKSYAPDNPVSAEDKVRYYTDQIEELTPPRTYTDRILVQVYRKMRDKYLKAATVDGNG